MDYDRDLYSGARGGSDDVQAKRQTKNVANSSLTESKDDQNMASHVTKNAI